MTSSRHRWEASGRYSKFRFEHCLNGLLPDDAIMPYHSLDADAMSQLDEKRLCHWLPDKRRLLKAVEKWLSIKVSASRLPADVVCALLVASRPDGIKHDSPLSIYYR
ncbi:hypothetical protein M514_06092 [Trichuris suis]|uniref:Uncharacterized protein n=1 Tax=Trichuris suis TaxID=68888 RepID=A0A085M6Y0_9BILA|nr:hypothetical protein M513_06092 [Trichuris suis]KFD69893.1 hypothetical protein M514_06092 [Trichuris suis]